jgi:phage FluMu gp28-like protein
MNPTEQLEQTETLGAPPTAGAMEKQNSVPGGSRPARTRSYGRNMRRRRQPSQRGAAPGSRRPPSSLRAQTLPEPFRGRAKIIPADKKFLLPYQRRWVQDTSRLKLAEKSRQIGWTLASAYGVVARQSVETAQRDAWISSRDDFQARLFLEDCKNIANILGMGAKAKDFPEEIVDATGHSSYLLQFNNGLRAFSMSSNPDAQAGKRGDRVLDEFALHLDPRKLYSIAFPGITWGGNLEIFSTHRGTANFFNELVNEIKYNGNPKGFSLHSVSLKDALDQGFLYKLQTKLRPGDPRLDMDESDYFSFIRSGCADLESFLEEFCCQPSDDNSAFLSYDLIAACEYPQGTDFEQKATKATKEDSLLPSLPSVQISGDLFIGVDVGRDRDLTVIWVLERLGDVLHTRDVICMDRQSFDSQEAVLYELLARPNLRRCCIDQTGLGRQFAERAIGRFGRYRVEGIQFTSGTKEELAYPVRAAFEGKTLRVPGDKFVRSDLHSLRKEVTASGNVRFTGERTQNGHADRFWALALALHAAKPAPAQYSATLC